LHERVPAIDHGSMAGTRVFPDDVPVLVDGDLTLRAHRLSDVDAIVEQCTDPTSIRWTTVPVPYAREYAVDFATKIMADGWTSGQEYGFALEAPHPGGERRFSGSLSLRWRGDGVAEVAFGLHPAVRGHGVCRRAVRLLVDWGFAELGVEVIVWFAEVGNWASRRVAWASGFSMDGTVAALLSKRGERKDAWTGSLRATDSREPKTPWNVVPVLDTERLRLRPLADEDGDRMYEMLFDEGAKHFAGRPRLLREAPSGDHIVLRAKEAEAKGERYDWAIADQDDDRIVGHIQVFDLEGIDESEAKLGYAIHPDRRGRGYLAEAMTAVTEWAFTPVAAGGLGRRRLSLRTAGTNVASRRGAERAGYTHIATEPEAFPVGDGDLDDLVVYHRVNPEWVRADPG
jgi:[ribosomal protein S5]-alanine N-acetyltransferase